MPVDEAVTRDTPYGRTVDTNGWFTMNLADAVALRNTKTGVVFPLQGQDTLFEHLGVNVRVLAPGQPNAAYHAESSQEAFLVLHGECTLIVEEQERTLRQWDFFHCPPGTHHIFAGAGAGAGPCAILMIGARLEQETLHYPVSELAARYGASATRETDNGDEAYADWPDDTEPIRQPWPLA